MDSKDKQIKALEEKNACLKKKVMELMGKLSRCRRSLYKEQDASFDAVDFDDDRR